MKHTKILATYGPSVNSVETLTKLIDAGVNAFRVNCSHGDKNDLIAAAKTIREATKKAKFPIGMLFDISGPKLRLDRFKGEIKIEAGQQITITSGESDLAANVIGVNHPAIISSVKKGERLLIDDGNMIFDILSASRTEVVARAQFAGTLLPAKGINLPDTDIQIPTITDKDKEDIKTAVECGADFIALSFVRSGDDIIEARQLLKKHGSHALVIAKLEKREAIGNLDEIMMVVDGVMVARGDLGVELPPAELPRLQKRIVRVANRYHRPVIVATQMMESMRFSPRATRAEINDVATAVFDFSDAVMLSAETASGDFPIEAVKAMADTIVAAEVENRPPTVQMDEHMLKSPVPYSIAGAVRASEEYCDTRAIFALTMSGYTAGLISKLFPPQLIVGLCPDEKVRRQMTLCRSVYAVPVELADSVEDVVRVVNTIGPKLGLVQSGDRVVITGGAPFGQGRPTNFMTIHEIA